MKAPRIMNRTHAKYEEACGLADVIQLLDPHLKGAVSVDGDPFSCPLPTHLKGDLRLMRIESGKNWSKPRWRCAAGCNGEKAEDTLTYIKERLQLSVRECVQIWSRLSKAPREQWQSIVEEYRPNFYTVEGEAKYVDEPLSEFEAEALELKHAELSESAYFTDTNVNVALAAYKEAAKAASKLNDAQAAILLEALKGTLKREGSE